MTEFLILVLFALAAVLWHRDRRLRQSIDAQNERIASLTHRIWNLESHGVAPAAPPPHVIPSAAPAPAPPPPPSLPLPAFTAPPPAPPPMPLPSMPLPSMAPPPPPPPAFVPAEPRPSWRDQFKGEEWEAILGGSILNKIGALILVIAIALLLKLSLEQLGPLGKIAVGALTGALILGAGVWIERKPKWRIFANGLLSAGWAILYFTSFATHGIPESRIFESSTVGLIVMLAVAGAMVAHSLRYDSQWVTGLAFFAAFAALQIDRGSVYSLAASAILAAGLLAVCYRRDWQTLALCGIGLAYLTVAFVVNPPIFWNGIGQPVLWIYWLLFEAFDLVLEFRASSRRTAMRQIHFLLNSFAFIGASLLATPPKTQPEHYSAFLGLATMGFTASFLLRFRQNPQAMAEHPILGGLTPSGLSLTVTSVLASFAILQRFEKLSATLAFVILGEVLFLFAWRIAQDYPRHLALAVQVFTFLKLIAFDVFQNGAITWMDRKIAAASPLLLLLAAVYYFNRSIAQGLLAPAYTWMASTAVFLVIGHEAPEEFACALWAGLGAILFEAGLRFRHSELRYQGYAAVAVSSSLAALYLAFGSKPIPWGAWVLSAAALAAITWRARQALAAELVERRIVVPVLPVLVTASLACLGWAATPSTLVAPVWGLTALLLVELAIAIEYPALRNSAIGLAIAAFGRLFLSNFAIAGRTGPISHRILTVAPFLACYYYLWSRTRFRLFLWAPPILMLFLVRFEIGRVYTAAGITFACLALLAIGFQRSIVDLRWQAYIGAIYAFFRSWAYSFAVPGQLMGIPLRVISASLVVTGFFAAQRLISRDAPTTIDRWARPAFPLLGSILMAGMLYHEVSGTVLTAAWSVEGAALLIAGFVLGERVMRFSGLGLFLFCIGKLFFYDLSSLEGIPRILSFIVLGVLLMGASWLYTRFREQLKRHL